eukprot:612586-Prorocentrum_minimum.AAC.1
MLTGVWPLYCSFESAAMAMCCAICDIWVCGQLRGCAAAHAGIYLPGDQPQGSHRVYTYPGTYHRQASGYIPARRPTTWEPA